MLDQNKAIFRGDNDILVDHLIFASNKKILNEPNANIFGRALQPYFADGEDFAPVTHRKFQSAGSPPKSSSKQAKGLKNCPSGPFQKTSLDGSVTPTQAASPGCPGFFSSPKPIDVPMPTARFLSKASGLGSSPETSTLPQRVTIVVA